MSLHPQGMSMLATIATVATISRDGFGDGHRR